MRKMTALKFWVALLAAGLVGGATAQEEKSIVAEWYASGGLGMIQFEGDEEVEDGFVLTGRLGYEWNEWWTLEGMAYLAPKLDENFGGQTTIENGAVVKRQVSQAPPERAGFGDTFAFGMVLDGLFHFTRWERLDPYLSLGGGFTWYGEDINGEAFDPSLRGGGGVMYHFNDEWAARADFRAFIAGNNTEANAIIDAGVAWYWGARVPPDYVAVGGPEDSDGDGLSDARENQLGTDPYDPDTDGDGLTDGEEVNQYNTDPLNPDTDFDGLKDGPEVKRHGTDPLLRDTDGGGVADGHEVIEDNTDPLDPSDDLLLFELNIQFDYDKAVVKERYFGQLDVIAKVLQRSPTAVARIEGHADRTRKSDAEYNQRLSKRRANAVLDYLAKHGGIDRGRLEAHGYGFSRPKAPNDPKHGNPVNRRVEIYIRGASEEDRAAPAALPEIAPENK